MKANKLTFKAAKTVATAIMSVSEKICDFSCRIINTQLPEDQRICRQKIRDEELKKVFSDGMVRGKQMQRAFDRVDMERYGSSSYRLGLYEALHMLDEAVRTTADAAETRSKRKIDDLIDSLGGDDEKSDGSA